MKLKGIKPWEQHIEKGVLGLCGIALAGGLVWQLFIQKAEVKVGNDTVAPADAFDPVKAEADRLRARIEAAERKFRSLFEQSPYGVMIADPDTGAILEVNAALADLLGWPDPESIVGLNVAALDAVKTRDETAKKLALIRAGAAWPATRNGGERAARSSMSSSASAPPPSRARKSSTASSATSPARNVMRPP